MTTKKDPKSQERYLVPAVEQAAQILNCLAQNNDTHMSLTEICAELGLHKSRAFSLLVTLEKYQLSQRNVGGKGYSLGLGVVDLSRKVLDDLHIPRLAEPILKELAIAANSTSILGLIINEDELMVAAKHEGGSELGISIKIGRRISITHSAEGKAIAAFLPKIELEKLLKRNNLQFYRSGEPIDMARLANELQECRRLGYALDLQDVKQAYSAVAAPVLNHAGLPIGHISILYLQTPERARELGPLVSKASQKLSQLIGAKMD